MSRTRDELSDDDLGAIAAAAAALPKPPEDPPRTGVTMVPGMVFTPPETPPEADIDTATLAAGLREAQARVVNRKTSLQVFVDPAALKDDIDIDPNSIQTEMLRQPALHAYYAVLASKADYQESVFRLRFETIEAQLSKRVRVELAKRHGKVTEVMVSETVKTQTAYQDAYMELAEAQSVAMISRSALRSIEQRRDMLVQINKDILQEKSSRFGASPTAVRGDIRERADKVLKRLAALRDPT